MKNNEFTTLWKEQFEHVVIAIVELFHPFVEVAVHDLKEGKLVAIYHNMSQRKVGDLSPLKELKINTKDFPDHFPPYYKQNWDGRSLKCTSVTIRDKKRKPIALICFNVDVSFFQEGHRLFEDFLKIKDSAENPIEIFGSHFENQTNSVLQEYLERHHLSLNHLNRDQKKEIVLHLYQKGIFNFKNAAPFVACSLKISRASVYNYIKAQVANSESSNT